MLDMHALNSQNIGPIIASIKQDLRSGLPQLKRVFTEVESHIRQQVDELKALHDRGEPIIPIIEYAEIETGRPSQTTIDTIRRRGAVIVRQVFPSEQAQAWNEQLGDYISRNGYYETEVDPSLDRYFSVLESGRPQIFGIYWSLPQVQARQAESMARTRAFLNSLWLSQREGEIYFHPDRECTYADRTRRREPGDRTLGLSPHMDAGSVERWLDPYYRQVYRHVFSGNWRAYDPFDGAFRAQAKEIPSPAVCSAFRTFQGWTALTPQGPHDGTLQLIPMADSIVYLLLRALLDDVPDDELAGAEPCRALSARPEWHAPLLEGVCSIPAVQPGDTVWWHPDLIHAVEDEHLGQTYSNVIYIASAPYCAKNVTYLEKQKQAFLEGKSAPDFAPENYEINYQGRATEADLTPLGRRQMGFDPW